MFPNAEGCTFLNSCVISVQLFRHVLAIQSRWYDDSTANNIPRIAFAKYVNDTQIIMSSSSTQSDVARLYGIK